MILVNVCDAYFVLSKSRLERKKQGGSKDEMNIERFKVKEGLYMGRGAPWRHPKRLAR